MLRFFARFRETGSVHGENRRERDEETRLRTLTDFEEPVFIAHCTHSRIPLTKGNCRRLIRRRTFAVHSTKEKAPLIFPFRAGPLLAR